MSVPVQNMMTLMQWLWDSDVAGAEDVTKDLGRLVFLGDLEWPNYDDRAASYAEAISAWLDAGTEGQFIDRTAEDGNLAAFISWMAPILEQWKAEASKDEVGQEGQGLRNPNYASDPTAGTQYYKYDAAAETYLYSSTAEGSDDWKTYEERRYSESTLDDSYGLRYRYDKRDEVYEWYDEENGTWNNQSWADQYAASHASQAAAAGAVSPAASAAEWDENWQMFYRIGPQGTYEYAHAVVPGNASSGCSEVWQSYEQVMQAGQEQGVPQAQAPQPVAQAQEAGQPSPTEIDAAVNELLKEHPEFAAIPEEERKQLISEVLAELGAS